MSAEGIVSCKQELEFDTVIFVQASKRKNFFTLLILMAVWVTLEVFTRIHHNPIWELLFHLCQIFAMYGPGTNLHMLVASSSIQNVKLIIFVLQLNTC